MSAVALYDSVPPASNSVAHVRFWRVADVYRHEPGPHGSSLTQRDSWPISTSNNRKCHVSTRPSRARGMPSLAARSAPRRKPAPTRRCVQERPRHLLGYGLIVCYLGLPDLGGFNGVRYRIGAGHLTESGNEVMAKEQRLFGT